MIKKDEKNFEREEQITDFIYEHSRVMAEKLVKLMVDEINELVMVGMPEMPDYHAKFTLMDNTIKIMRHLADIWKTSDRLENVERHEYWSQKYREEHDSKFLEAVEDLKAIKEKLGL